MEGEKERKRGKTDPPLGTNGGIVCERGEEEGEEGGGEKMLQTCMRRGKDEKRESFHPSNVEADGMSGVVREGSRAKASFPSLCLGAVENENERKGMGGMGGPSSVFFFFFASLTIRFYFSFFFFFSVMGVDRGREQ